MYCTNCGKALGDLDRFCSECGKATGVPRAEEVPPPRAEYAGPRPRLARAMADKKIAGVCAGIARYLSLDVTLVRVLFILAIFFHLWGLLIYGVAWAAMPRDDQNGFYAAGYQAR